MNKIVFATRNKHKVEEIKAMLGGDFEIITMSEAGLNIEIPEPHPRLEENAMEKARVIFDLTGWDCFGEDTGLEVEALGGEPGVRSARYAGEDKSFQKNIEKLLAKLHGRENRKARFRTVIALIKGGQTHQFEGICNGRILSNQRGLGGFGYDPVFVPEGSEKSFAEMSMTEKNMYSHRRIAMDQLLAFLKEKTG